MRIFFPHSNPLFITREKNLGPFRTTDYEHFRSSVFVMELNILFRFFVGFMVILPTSLFESYLKPRLFEQFLVDFLEAKQSKGVILFKDPYLERKDKWNSFIEETFYLISEENRFYTQIIYLRKSNESNWTKSLPRLNNFLLGKNYLHNFLFVSLLFTPHHLKFLRKMFLDDDYKKHQWLILCKETSLSFVKSLELTPNNWALFIKYFEEGFEIIDYYRTVPNGYLHKTTVTLWLSSVPQCSKSLPDKEPLSPSSKTSKEKFQRDLREFYPMRERKNLSEVYLNCILIELRQVIYRYVKADGEVAVGGPSGQIWQFLQEFLHFKYNATVRDDEVYGIFNESSKSWTGIMGDLKENRYNFSLAELSLLSSRFGVIDNLSPIQLRRWILFYKNPKTQDKTLKSLLAHYVIEFTPFVWILIGFTLVACFLFLKIITYLHPWEASYTDSDGLLFVISSFCNVGFERSFKSNSGKIFSLTISLAFFLFFTHYSSFLISSLATDNQNLPFKDLKGLYGHKDDYKLAFVKESPVHYFFKNSCSPLMQNIWNEMKFTREADYPSTRNELLSVVHSGRTASVFETDAINADAGIDLVLFTLDTVSHLAFGVPMNFTLKKIFDH